MLNVTVIEPEATRWYEAIRFGEDRTEESWCTTVALVLLRIMRSSTTQWPAFGSRQKATRSFVITRSMMAVMAASASSTVVEVEHKLIVFFCYLTLYYRIIEF